MSPHQFSGRAHRARPRLRQRLLAIVLTLSLLFNMVLVPGVSARSVPQETPQTAGESTPDGNPVTHLFLPLIQSNATVMASDLATEVQAASPPVPSGALPAYPPNHMVDGLYQSAGTLPPNYNFEAAGSSIGTRPANYDFSAAPYDFGAPPTNYDFEAGNFTGWMINSQVDMQSDTTHGSFARLKNSSSVKGAITSDPFTVDLDTQKLIFQAGALAAGIDNRGRVYIFWGSGYANSEFVDFDLNNGIYWTDYEIDLSKWLGQSIKVKFERSAGTIGIDRVRTKVLLPNYKISGETWGLSETLNDGNINTYTKLGSKGTITSTAFTVDANVSMATIQLKGFSTTNSYRIDALSNPNFTTITSVKSGYVGTNWESIQLNFGSWLGQSIKLKISLVVGAIGVDDIAVQTLSPANWQVTGDTYLVNDGGNHYVFTNATLTSNPFTVASNVQQFTLRYQGLLTNNKFSVKLLYGQNFSDVEVLAISELIPASGVWETLKVAIGHHAGETVKIKLEQVNGRLYFDDVGVGERLLPGWQMDSAGAIATGEDSFGSYVTSEYGGAFTIRAQPITMGLVDGGNADKRYYAVAYAIGQHPSSMVRVYWHSEQLNTTTQKFSETANTPTGYRVRYFSVPDYEGQRGYFIVNVTQGGKLYSIADNIGRQHLNEPFSYKAGIEIDTATGSFGYRMSDLQVDSAMPLFFTRFYNGHSDLPGVLGYGWSHSYETRLVFTQEGDAGVLFGSGKEVFFVKNPTTGLFLPADARVHNTLVQNGDGSYTFTIKAAPEPNYTTDMSCSPLDLQMIKIGPQKQTYHFNAAGQLTSLQDPNGRTVTLHYDALNRLDAVTYPAIPGGPPAATIDYSMDEVGNRIGDGSTTTYGYDASDRITNAGFSYDTNGNLLSDGAKSYEYDAANRLTKVISGSVTINYAYDGWVNLILESSNGITTEYVLDENAPLARVLGEVRSDGSERLYAYGPEGFAAQKTVGGGIEYPLLDGLGSVRQLTDNNGSIVLYRSYDAFGTIRYSSGADSSRLGYTGELQNTATGLVYLRARFYHPVLGRFLQRDSFAGSVGQPQSLNRYVYGFNNPLLYLDPSGHDPLDWKWEVEFNKQHGHLPTDEDRRDRLFELINPGSGNNREWTDGDRAYYRENKSGLFTGGDQWNRGDRAMKPGVDRFAEHVSRLASYYEKDEQNAFVMALGLLYAGIPYMPPTIAMLYFRDISPYDEGMEGWDPAYFDPTGDNTHHFIGLFYVGYFFFSWPGTAINWCRDAFAPPIRFDGWWPQLFPDFNPPDLVLGDIAAYYGELLRLGHYSIDELDDVIKNVLKSPPKLYVPFALS